MLLQPGAAPIDEILAGLFGRSGRTLLTVFGTSLGIGALVAIVGIAQTAAEQIAERIDAEEATRVTISSSDRGRLPWSAPDRVVRLNGVEAAGTLPPVGYRAGTTLVATGPAGVSERTVSVAASPGLFPVLGLRTVLGRTFDVGHDRRAERVCVVGVELAAELQLPAISSQPTLSLDGVPYVVLGTFEDRSRSGLAEQVVVPQETARRELGWLGLARCTSGRNSAPSIRWWRRPWSCWRRMSPRVSMPGCRGLPTS